MENHCTSVNFPLVSPRAGRMAARLLEYAALRVHKRIQKKENERRSRAKGVKKREKEWHTSVHPPRVYVYTRPRYSYTRVYSENVPRENSTGWSVGPFACSSFPDPSRIFSPFEFRLRCGCPITKKFLSTSSSSLRFATESLFEILIFTSRSFVLEYYSRPIKASDSLVGLSHQNSIPSTSIKLNCRSLIL